MWTVAPAFLYKCKIHNVSGRGSTDEIQWQSLRLSHQSPELNRLKHSVSARAGSGYWGNSAWSEGSCFSSILQGKSSSKLPFTHHAVHQHTHTHSFYISISLRTISVCRYHCVNSRLSKQGTVARSKQLIQTCPAGSYTNWCSNIIYIKDLLKNWFKWETTLGKATKIHSKKENHWSGF